MTEQNTPTENTPTKPDATPAPDKQTTEPSAVENARPAVTSPEPVAAKPEPTLPPAAPVQKSSGKGLSVVAILISLMALGGSGATLYTNYIQKELDDSKAAVELSGISSDIKVIGERMSRFESEQQTTKQGVVSKEFLTNRLLESNNQVELKLRDLQQTQKSLEESVAKVSGGMRRGADELALDEVSQLLKLANNSAVFSGDKESAINALKLADIQLKSIADPRYALVRRKINEEVAKLEAVQIADTSSLTAQLSVLAQRVPSLPLENEPPVVESLTIAQPEAPEQWTFKSELKAIWTDVKNTVKISRVDQPPKPLLAPEQRYFLNQNLQLELTKAELAVMQRKPEVYQRSIDSAVTWLQEYFDPRHTGVQKTISELQSLKAQPVGVQLPTVADSYDALQQIKGGN